MEKDPVAEKAAKARKEDKRQTGPKGQKTYMADITLNHLIECTFKQVRQKVEICVTEHI